jgi:Mn2+/Fe2+ NRAMP family transporter
MQQFKMDNVGFKKFTRKYWIITTALTIITTSIIFTTGHNSADPGDINVLPYVIPFLAVMIGFNIYRSFKKQKKFLQTYAVTISADGITREQMNTPPLSISSIEIREIIKTKKGSFTIKGLNRTDVIHIPYWIENPASVEEHLQKLAPVMENKKDARTRNYRRLLAILAIVSMICLFTISNKIVTMICGPLLIGFLVWALYEVQTSKSVPTNAKRRNWTLLIPIIVIAYFIYLRLKGLPMPF